MEMKTIACLDKKEKKLNTKTFRYVSWQFQDYHIDIGFVSYTILTATSETNLHSMETLALKLGFSLVIQKIHLQMSLCISLERSDWFLFTKKLINY